MHFFHPAKNRGRDHACLFLVCWRVANRKNRLALPANLKRTNQSRAGLLFRRDTRLGENICPEISHPDDGLTRIRAGSK